MDGKQRQKNVASSAASSAVGRGHEELRNVLALCDRTLLDVRTAQDPGGIAGLHRRLNEFGSALATVRTRLEVAVVLGNVPGVVSGPQGGPVPPEALERLRRAINVIARRDT